MFWCLFGYNTTDDGDLLNFAEKYDLKGFIIILMTLINLEKMGEKPKRKKKLLTHTYLTTKHYKSTFLGKHISWIGYYNFIHYVVVYTSHKKNKMLYVEGNYCV